MKKIVSLFLIALSLGASATTWQVQVLGETGNENNPPVYNPSFIDIYEGDEIMWVFVTGPHTVTSNGGVTSFDSGIKQAGETFTVSFPTSGFITYESEVAGDSETMFGSIFVNPGTSVAEAKMTPAYLEAWPNPAQDVVYLNNTASESIAFTVYNSIGAMVHSNTISRMDKATLSVAEWPNGCYFIQWQQDDAIRRMRLIISK
jgi:plastocyanin